MLQLGPIFSRFFAVRGTHLAAMVAYFALASFVPLIFLTLALLGLFGRADESTLLVDYLEDVFPGASVDAIVRVVNTVQDNARTLGLVGGVALLWSSLSFFSALESAYNIVYDRPNRSFLRGKALASGYMVVALVVLFVGLVVGTIGHDLLRRYAPDALSTRWVSLAIGAAISGLALLLFLVSSYYRLTNARMRKRDALPGALLATVAIVLTLQALPLFVDLASGIVALQALGATFLLLLWLYVMANVIVFGSVVNWQLAHGRKGTTALPRHDVEAPVDADLEDTADDAWVAPAPAPPVTPPETATAVREPTELR